MGCSKVCQVIFAHNISVLLESIKKKQNSHATSCDVNIRTQRLRMEYVNLIFVPFPVKVGIKGRHRSGSQEVPNSNNILLFPM